MGEQSLRERIQECTRSVRLLDREQTPWVPTPRRAMLVVAPAMAAVTAYRLIRHRAPPYQRAISLLSRILMLGLLAWSVVQCDL